MKSAIVSAILGAAMLTQQAVAHPGASHAEHVKDVQAREAHLKHINKRSLSHCADTLKKRGNDKLMQDRRNAKVERGFTDKPFLRARDVTEVLATSHLSSLTDITADTDPSVLFAGNSSCILTPEVTQGPYWVSGELIRTDNTEGQQGVPLTLDIQIIDVNTCEPVPQVYLEIWACNSTGVYSGVSANGNGNTNDETNIDATFMRAIQVSDDSGVVAFDTLVPGHYTGRANHIHALSHVNATVLPNNTLAGGSITHVGQMFFDQDLLTLVETTEPYNTNTQTLTTNAEDGILAQEADGYDPMVEYVLLGDDVSQGIFAWISFGMDTASNYTVSPAVYLTSDGGVENENFGAGMGAPPSGSGAPGPAPTGASAS